MQATTEKNEKTIDDGEKTLCGPESRARRLASAGLETTQDIRKLGLALAEDILNGDVSHKVAGPVCRSVTLTIRTAEFEFNHGNGQPVNLVNGSESQGDEKPIDPLAEKEAELLEQLAKIRKERLAS